MTKIRRILAFIDKGVGVMAMDSTNKLLAYINKDFGVRVIDFIEALTVQKVLTFINKGMWVMIIDLVTTLLVYLNKDFGVRIIDFCEFVGATTTDFIKILLPYLNKGFWIRVIDNIDVAMAPLNGLGIALGIIIEDYGYNREAGDDWYNEPLIFISDETLYRIIDEAPHGRGITYFILISFVFLKWWAHMIILLTTYIFCLRYGFVSAGGISHIPVVKRLPTGFDEPFETGD